MKPLRRTNTLPKLPSEDSQDSFYNRGADSDSGVSSARLKVVFLMTQLPDHVDSTRLLSLVHSVYVFTLTKPPKILQFLCLQYLQYKLLVFSLRGNFPHLTFYHVHGSPPVLRDTVQTKCFLCKLADGEFVEQCKSIVSRECCCFIELIL